MISPTHYLIKKEARKRILSLPSLPSSQPTVQPTVQPTSSSSAPTVKQSIPLPRLRVGSYIEYVYTDDRCSSSPVFISVQILNTCYRQSMTWPSVSGRPVFLKSFVAAGNQTLTEIDYFYRDPSCTNLIRNLTLIHPATSSSCSPLRSVDQMGAMISGYYVTSAISTANVMPSQGGLQIYDYSQSTCDGTVAESYFIATGACVFNKYMASCTGQNNGPVVTTYEANNGMCRGKITGVYSLSRDCGTSTLGGGQFEITSGCPTAGLASLIFIELFIGMVLLVFVCGCCGCACTRMMFTWRRNAALVVIEGGDPLDRYMMYQAQLHNVPYHPHMTVHFAVPAQAHLPGSANDVCPDLDTPVAFATPMTMTGGQQPQDGQPMSNDLYCEDIPLHVATAVVPPPSEGQLSNIAGNEPVLAQRASSIMFPTRYNFPPHATPATSAVTQYHPVNS